MSTYLREGLQKRGVREKQFFHEFLGRTAVVGERSIPFIGSRYQTNLFPGGEARMSACRNRSKRLSLERRSQYPLPRGLFTGFSSVE